jgi:hypothetical protein
MGADSVEEKVRHIVSEEIQKGGKPVTEQRYKDFCPTCGAPADHRHIQTDLEIEKDRHQRDVERLTEVIEQLNTGHPPPEKVIPHWETCPDCKPKFDSAIKPKLDEAYKKGRTDALKSPTSEEIPSIAAKAIGEWIRYYKAKEGK